MNAQEFAQCRAAAELYRRARRENDRLRAENEALRKDLQLARIGYSSASVDFEKDNLELFEVVNNNHLRHCGQDEVFRMNGVDAFGSVG